MRGQTLGNLALTALLLNHVVPSRLLYHDFARRQVFMAWGDKEPGGMRTHSFVLLTRELDALETGLEPALTHVRPRFFHTRIASVGVDRFVSGAKHSLI